MIKSKSSFQTFESMAFRVCVGRREPNVILLPLIMATLVGIKSSIYRETTQCNYIPYSCGL